MEAKGITAMGKGQEILFVEDEEALLKLGQKILERIGYRVIAVDDPVAALERIKTEPERFSLLITDLTMPRMTGMELAKEATRLRANLPVIVITGDPTLLDSEDLKASGIRAIVAKPFAVKTVADAIEEVLSPIA